MPSRPAAGDGSDSLLLVQVITMKRGNIGGILLQEVQRENSRLKEELIALRRELNAFEDKMMQELARLDPSKIIYDSPMQCLAAFVHQLATITQDYDQKNAAIRQLQIQTAQSEQKNARHQLQAQIDRKRIGELEGFIREEQAKAREAEVRLTAQVRELGLRNGALEMEVEELKHRMELKQISVEEERRVAVSAILHQSKKEMLEFREQLETELLNDTAKLREEIKGKDEKIRTLIKGLLKFDKGERVAQAEIAEMRELVSYIGSVQQLNSTIQQLRDEAFILRREAKDTLNKKSATDLKNAELRNEISNLTLRCENKDAQIRSLEEAMLKVRQELACEKESSKKLENYYEVKWHNEFEKVKGHLEKAYHEKIADHEKEVEGKKAEISRKIESYVFIHNEDEKIAKDLKERIAALATEVESKKTLIAHEKAQFMQLWREKDETCLMAEEEIHAVSHAWSLKLLRKQQEIRQLEQELSNSCLDKQSIERTTAALSSSLQQSFTAEKRKIEEEHARQREELSRQKASELELEQQRYQELLLRFKRTIEQLKTEHEFQLAEAKVRLGKDVEALKKEVEQQRESQKEYMAAAEGREKGLKKEIQDLKQYYMKKIYDLEREVENKKANLKVISSKSENDEDLKKELRAMIEQKAAECRELARARQDLEDELQARESEVHHLTHENTGLRMSKEDWLRIIVEVRDEFQQDLAAIDENHWRQVQALKSRIWQLENVISKRPIRLQDEKKIRSLSEQKRELENKIDIKEAENIVLKQIKHYYEKRIEVRTCASQMSCTETDLKKPNTVLIMAKRPRRTKVNLNQHLKREDEDDGEANNDIKKMRKYLERFRSTHQEGNEAFHQKMAAKPRPSSRNYVNRSLEA